MSTVSDKDASVELEVLRKKINPFTRIDALLEIDGLLETGWRTMTKNQIDALKARADVQFRLLTFAMPTLKGVEMNMGKNAMPVKFVFNSGSTASPEEARAQAAL